MFCLQNKKEGMVSDYSDSFVSSQNRSLYATCSSWHIDPCRFPMKCGGYNCWATYTPAQLRS